MNPQVPLPISGGCQCGAIRYQLNEPPLMIYACHCTNCQRIAGSAFGLAANVKEASLEITSGEPASTTWRSEAGNERYGRFCGDCGCRIFHGQNPSMGILTLRAGTIDDPGWVRPAAHIWTRSAQPWFTIGEDEIQWPEQPTDYVPIIQKFQASVSFEG